MPRYDGGAKLRVGPPMRAAALGVSNVLPTTLNGWVAPRKGMIRMIKPRQHVGWLAALCALVIPGVVVSAADAAVPPRERAVLAAPVRHMRAGGVDFAYRAIGSGRPLVLIDGLEATMSSEWDPAVLAQLVAHHRVVLYDHRGVGLSRGDVSSMTVAQLSDDAAALIHALHLSAPDVWGQSLGGDVAEDLVVRHPTAVRRVVLTGASAGGGEDHWIPSTVQNGPKPGDRDGIERIIFTPDAAGRAARRAFDERVARWRPHESLTPEARSAEYAAGAGFWSSPPKASGRSWRGFTLPFRRGRPTRCGRPSGQRTDHRGAPSTSDAAPLSSRPLLLHPGPGPLRARSPAVPGRQWSDVMSAKVVIGKQHFSRGFSRRQP